MKADYVIAGLILVVAFGGIGLYLYSRKLAADKRQALVAKRAAADPKSIESGHTICDPIRLEIVKAEAELASIQWDPVKSDNIRGFLNIKRAELAQCERQETRNELT